MQIFRSEVGAVLFIAGGILFLVSAVWLAVTAGRKPGDEELYLTVFDHWKTEISACTGDRSVGACYVRRHCGGNYI